MVSFFDLQLKERGQATTRQGVRAAETRVRTVGLDLGYPAPATLTGRPGGNPLASPGASFPLRKTGGSTHLSKLGGDGVR